MRCCTRTRDKEELVNKNPEIYKNINACLIKIFILKKINYKKEIVVVKKLF